jgi:hypothetical protein
MRKNNTPWKYLGLVIVLGIAASIGWWLLSPLWVNVEVSESFPTAVAPVITESSESVVVEPIATVAVPVVTAPDASMAMLAQGSFYNVAHVGSGQAGVYQLADGSRILRLENFQVENGPDLYVYLVPVDSVPNTTGSEIPGSVSLGRLKGNVGDQNYEIPADLDLGQYKSVVIWCQAFAVPFSAAPLTAQ